MTLSRDPAPAAPSDEVSAWQPFARAEFRGLWSATAAGHLANWMQQVGAASLMTTLTPSPMMTALVQTAASLPAVLLGLPAGALADLVERRRWLIATQLWLLCAAALACAVVGLGAVSPWGLLALTTLLGIGFAVQAPASQAVIGEVVPRHEMTSALALAGVSFNISRIVGPALAGALIGLAGGMAVYAAVAVCSIASLTVLLRWRGLRRGSSLPPERLWSALRSGVRFVWHTPSCRVALRHTLVFMTCGSAAWALLPVLARDAYHLGAGGYGLLLGAFGIGGLAGVVVLPRLRRGRSPHGVVSLSALVFAGVTAVLACKAPLFVTLPALVVGGMAWMSGASLIYASVQVALPDWVRARGVSIYNLIYFLAMAGGAALWGAMAAAFGSQVALTLAALAMAAAAAYLRRTPLSIGAGRIVYPGEAGQGGAPTLDGALSPEEDPVLVQRIYRVRPDAVDAFLRAARGAGRSCRRNGASFWRIYRDLQTPGAYVERYMVDSWGELERHYERMTPEDRELRSRLDQHLVPGSEPVVHHYAVQSLPPEEDPTQFP